MGPGKTTDTFSVTVRLPLPPFCVVPPRRGGGTGGNGKFVGISGKRIRYFTHTLKVSRISHVILQLGDGGFSVPFVM